MEVQQENHTAKQRTPHQDRQEQEREQAKELTEVTEQTVEVASEIRNIAEEISESQAEEVQQLKARMESDNELLTEQGNEITRLGVELVTINVSRGHKTRPRMTVKKMNTRLKLPD